MTDVEPLIQLQQVTKRYPMSWGELEALAPLSLEVASGELLAIMGPSGSGKSTLMHLLGCLDRPSGGSYLLRGADVSYLSDRELAQLRASSIGFVFQSFNLLAQLTVYENVELPFQYSIRKAPSSQEKILEAIELVGLSHRLHHHPHQLSGGEMQRVAIARAIAIDPLLILADEPTGNLDSQTGQKILELFGLLHQRGVTLLIVTHDSRVGRSCSRRIEMRDGQLIRDTREDKG